MKKTSILLGLVTMGLYASAQLPTRMALYEEFTGENCPPCAATNPALDALLAANPTKVIALKWQVPIPSAPSNTWSLYRTNQAEINWRYQGSGYGYQSQNTATTAPTNGINSAPSGKMNGDNVWVYGAASNHPANLTTAAINAAQTATTPFSINLATSYDSGFNNCVVTVTIQSAAAFTTPGQMRFRLCLVERKIEFATAPGTNGEKLFHDVVRKSYPTTTSGTVVTGMGTNISNSWTNGQTETYTINCAIPSYIVDKSEMAFVGFIQDDNDKKIWQAARSAQASIPNDIKVSSVNVPAFQCATSITPTVNLLNQGPNAITAMTIVPSIDGVPQTPINWTGSLASTANTVMALGTYTAGAGNHTVTVNVTGVSGGDVNSVNNIKSTNIALVQNYFAAPLAEAFTPATFPPTNWFAINADLGPAWSRNNAGLNGAGSAKYDFYNNSSTGDMDELYLTPSNFTGLTAPMMSFDVAYAQYSNENDRLEVKVSTDCGANWTTVFNKAGSTLATVAAQTGAFTPATAGQWRNESFALPVSTANNASVLVKFVATSAYGNNLYVDNVNISQNTTSIKTHNASAVNVVMYPNPTSEFANLDITSKEAVNANIIVYNALGQMVFEKSVKLNQGFNSLNLDTKNFAAGIYNVVIAADNAKLVQKLTVTK
jgi:hypothetical protein